MPRLQGSTLRPGRDPRAIDYGGYMLVAGGSNIVVAGGQPSAYSLAPGRGRGIPDRVLDSPFALARARFVATAQVVQPGGYAEEAPPGNAEPDGVWALEYQGDYQIARGTIGRERAALRSRSWRPRRRGRSAARSVARSLRWTLPRYRRPTSFPSTTSQALTPSQSTANQARALTLVASAARRPGSLTSADRSSRVSASVISVAARRPRSMSR